jgi:hypothetical protein
MLRHQYALRSAVLNCTCKVLTTDKLSSLSPRWSSWFKRRFDSAAPPPTSTCSQILRVVVMCGPGQYALLTGRGAAGATRWTYSSTRFLLPAASSPLCYIPQLVETRRSPLIDAHTGPRGRQAELGSITSGPMARRGCDELSALRPTTLFVPLTLFLCTMPRRRFRQFLRARRTPLRAA